MACLCLLASLLVNDSETTKKPKSAERTILEVIPNVQLDLTYSKRFEVLTVELDGLIETPLEWVIFQPKGPVISKISTISKINEIDISRLAPGSYVLMLKDASGRAIFKKFEK